MSRVKEGGFTLVEMMVALLVLAVLIVISAPGFSDLIKDNRMLSHVYAMRAALNGARSEALAQRNFVTLCRSTDGMSCSTGSGDWNTGFIAFLDDDANHTVSDPNEQIFISKVIDEDSLSVSYSNGDWVQFDSRGYAAQSSQGTFKICDDRDEARGVKVTAGGMVLALDPNDSAITCP